MAAASLIHLSDEGENLWVQPTQALDDRKERFKM
jgi:hypothetical protein